MVDLAKDEVFPFAGLNIIYLSLYCHTQDDQLSSKKCEIHKNLRKRNNSWSTDKITNKTRFKNEPYIRITNREFKINMINIF